MRLYRFGNCCIYWGPAITDPTRKELVVAWNDVRLCTNRKIKDGEHLYGDAFMIAFDEGSWKPIFRYYSMHWKEFYGL